MERNKIINRCVILDNTEMFRLDEMVGMNKWDLHAIEFHFSNEKRKLLYFDNQESRDEFFNNILLELGIIEKKEEKKAPPVVKKTRRTKVQIKADKEKG